MHIVIVAGGLGSRLAPLTNCVPKFLVNIGKQTGYVEQVRYWQQSAVWEHDSLTVIVHSAYERLVRAYHHMYFPHVPLIVKTVDVANGSAHAILSTCQHLEGESNVFFQWCDVIPRQILSVEELDQEYGGATVIFTNHDHPNRYGVSKIGNGFYRQTELQLDGRGGVFGLYYLAKFHTSVKFTDDQDFVEVINQYGPICEHPLNSIIDFGDKPKLERTRDTADQAREFNRVEFHGDLVLKSPVNEQGAALAVKEVAWYRELERLESKARVPKVWSTADNSSFVMSKVCGMPVYQLWPSLDEEGRALVLTRVLEQLDLLHGTDNEDVWPEQIADDIKTEAHDKLISRYTEIKHVIDAFGRVTSVNGRKLLDIDPTKTIQRMYTALMAEYATTASHKYSVIHGDLQFSNSMINPDTMEVTLIDPRGYFGKTKMYGLADYDLAKLLYSLTGYDLFNYSREFHIESIQNGEIKFTMPRPEISGCEAIVADRFKYVHKLWLAVIWMGLAGFIKNDPVKSVCAHYYGLAMAERLLTA